MTNRSYIDAEAVAAELLEGAEVAYGYPEDSKLVRRVELPDGRVATLRVRFDEHATIGRWIDRSGKESRYEDDVFGVFCFRGTDRDTGLPGSRPDGFDGRAKVLRPRDNGARIGESVWWQPPADVEPEHLPELESSVRAYLERGEWEHVGVVVRILEHGEEVGADSCWAVEWGTGDDSHVREVVAQCLEESGIGRPSTAGVARWARDPLEAVARRVSGGDPDDDDTREQYESTLAALLRWWREEVEPAGDWDTFADAMTSDIERLFRGGARHTIHGWTIPPNTNTESDR